MPITCTVEYLRRSTQLLYSFRSEFLTSMSNGIVEIRMSYGSVLPSLSRSLLWVESRYSTPVLYRICPPGMLAAKRRQISPVPPRRGNRNPIEEAQGRDRK